MRTNKYPLKDFIEDKYIVVNALLIQAELIKDIGSSKKVYDEWGNEIGLDGALSEEVKIYVK